MYNKLCDLSLYYFAWIELEPLLVALFYACPLYAAGACYVIHFCLFYIGVHDCFTIFLDKKVTKKSRQNEASTHRPYSQPAVLSSQALFYNYFNPQNTLCINQK